MFPSPPVSVGEVQTSHTLQLVAELLRMEKLPPRALTNTIGEHKGLASARFKQIFRVSSDAFINVYIFCLFLN